MIRNEFIKIVTDSGMANQRELKRISIGKDDEVNNFYIINRFLSMVNVLFIDSLFRTCQFFSISNPPDFKLVAS
jgi:hypothetical protein